jgi:hypothetical protein
MIFDENYRQNYPLGPYPPAADYPVNVACFDTLAELAAHLDLPAEGLEESVTRFNSFAESGEDTDFGRGTLTFERRAYGDPRYRNPNLGLVAREPFYAVPLTILGVGLCSLGLAIDEHAQVLRRDDSPIQGLYATGNAAATRELKGYVTGLANARNYTYAYTAATHMLAQD